MQLFQFRKVHRSSGKDSKVPPLLFCYLSQIFYALDDVTYQKKEPQLSELQVNQN